MTLIKQLFDLNMPIVPSNTSFRDCSFELCPFQLLKYEMNCLLMSNEVILFTMQ